LAGEGITMAKKDTDLFRQSRSSAVRITLARSVSASDRTAGSNTLLRSADRLREVADARKRSKAWT
jgi:hypothetical protein